MTLRVAWFATAKGTSSRLLFNCTKRAIDDGRLDAEIVCVVCNREEGHSPNTDRFIADVIEAEVPLIAKSSLRKRRKAGAKVSIPSEELPPWRHEYDKRLYKRIQEFEPDIGILAGYMLVMTHELYRKLPCLNLHPALPGGPIGTWQQVIHQLIDKRADHSGMVLQRVTGVLDRGPVATWAQYPIVGPKFDELWLRDGDDPWSETGLFRAIREAGVIREKQFLLQSLRALASGSAPVPECDSVRQGIDLTDQVEGAISVENE